MLSKPTALSRWESNSASLHQTQDASYVHDPVVRERLRGAFEGLGRDA